MRRLKILLAALWTVFVLCSLVLILMTEPIIGI